MGLIGTLSSEWYAPFRPLCTVFDAPLLRLAIARCAGACTVLAGP